jgi:hypothetical protein
MLSITTPLQVEEESCKEALLSPSCSVGVKQQDGEQDRHPTTMRKETLHNFLVYSIPIDIREPGVIQFIGYYTLSFILINEY